ncbi:macro domain-containing protein [Chitinophaga sp. GbtcB8]|uniref:type II toxin-antitoxin system antitoxin DNA ADP-ribosyl glycohydrolase DarG n=1 Tax=Chitinophaga sp. GbtcB8 TaxID=2824753 RepID=UPI001C300586|nr:macro domain-containing protein [Chitinophaga sp. GbtcB8]
MIQYITGNLLNSDASALVNTVNTVGVMGKGLALQFREAFPVNYKKYVDACKAQQLNIGTLLIVQDHNEFLGEKTIINFPTKKHWRQSSKYEYIEAGLTALVEAIQDNDIQSIALPPLGCGNGGLDWQIVKPLIENRLSTLNSTIYIYEPNKAIKELLQQEQSPKKEIMLNPVRAQFLYLMFYYENLGEHNSLFSANKLAYFLQLAGEKMQMDFIPHLFGPYSSKIADVLYALNGKYLKGFEQKQAKAFEPLFLNHERKEEVENYVQTQLTSEQKDRLKQLLQLIDGFQSELSLEVLASVAYILCRNPAYTPAAVFQEIQQWNERKSELIRKEHVDIAYNHLKAHRNLLRSA